MGTCRELQIIHTDFKPENVMLMETLTPRHWEMSLQPPGGSSAAAGGGGSSAQGQPAAGTHSGSLTKNQKKKAKRKAKKAAAAGSQDVSDKWRASKLQRASNIAPPLRVPV